MEQSIRLFIDTLESIFRNTPLKNEQYNADFAPPSYLLSPNEKGFCLTGDKNISQKLSYNNALIVAQTGGGKSSVVLINSLLTMNGSFIVNDPSGDLVKTAGALHQKKYLIKVLNFSNPIKTSGYNPIIRANSTTEIQKLAHILITGGLGNNSKDKFWDNSAISLLVMLIRILKTQDIQYQNLYNVLHLLNSINGNPDLVDRLFSEFADNTLFTAFKSFLSSDDKVLSGTIATVKAALVIFNDENVARVTSIDTIDMEEFRRRPIALFVQNSVSDYNYFSSLLNTFYEQFFSYILSYLPGEDEQPIFFLLDEASSIRPIILPMALANCRKHRCGVLLAVQDTAQLVHNFGREQAAAIMSNCVTKLYLGGQSWETASEISKTLGRFEFKDKDGRKVIRELMTPDEIIRMKSNSGLILSGNLPPIWTELVPYYASRKRLRMTQIPPPEIYSDIPETVTTSDD